MRKILRFGTIWMVALGAVIAIKMMVAEAALMPSNLQLNASGALNKQIKVQYFL